MDYLDSHGLKALWADVLAGAAAARPEDPGQYVAAAWARIASGKHVLGREYDFVVASSRNRACFLALVGQAYAGLGNDFEITPDDAHHLLLDLCPDFPREVVASCWPVDQSAGDGVTAIDQPSTGGDRLPFGDFLSALELAIS